MSYAAHLDPEHECTPDERGECTRCHADTAPPTAEQIKLLARQLAERHLKATGEKMKHGVALNAVSRQFGFKDWNHLSAVIKREAA